MRLLKYIFLISLAISLFSCSDDFGIKENDSYVKEGYLRLSINMAEPQKVQTRAGEDAENERKIESLTALIFNAEGTLILKKSIEVQSFNDGEDNYKNTFNLEYGDLQLSGNETLYLIANYNEFSSLTKDASKLENLNLITENSLATEKKKFVMSGKLSSINKNGENQVNLYRTAAKISIKPGSKGSFYEIRNSAKEGYITAYYQNTKYTSDYSQTKSVYNNVTYIYPTEAEKAFMIVKANFPEDGDTEYYYKVAFLDQEDNYLEIQPNHWYEVEITSVDGKGYSDADEAAKHEPSNLTVKIYDHEPTVFSLASDGIRELGVTTPLTRNISTQTSEEDENQDYLYIRIYSIDSAEFNITNDNIKIFSETLAESSIEFDYLTLDYSEISHWFSFERDPEDNEKVRLFNSDSDVDTSHHPADEETTAASGKVIKLHPKFNSENLTDLNSVEGDVKVYWKNLERTIHVIWNRAFSAEQVSTVKLIIHNADEDNQDQTIENYWTFLAGAGTLSASKNSTGNEADKTPILYGLNEGDMSPTKVRNQGFHFPIMYGNKEINKWWYEYEITPKTDATSVNIAAASDNQGFLSSLLVNDKTGSGGSWENVTLENGKLRLSSKDFNQYDYCTGTLTISAGEKAYTFDLYHTGFFHYDADEKSIGKESEKPGYYYYEVIKLDGSNDEYTYWLDRNLGATSAGLYIQDGNGVDVVENSWPYTVGAKGGYYKFNDVSCPPGYQIPSKGDWDNIRLSSKFHNEQRVSSLDGSSISYYTSYFQPTENEMVLFPKSRYYNIKQNGQLGDAYAGYYWTATEDNDGWNKVLYMEGSSNFYVLGDRENYGMSVRCVSQSGGNITTTNHTISFNVTGATHVYLYRYNSQGERTGLFPWPGKAIGNAMSMSTGGYDGQNGSDNVAEIYRKKIINFSYTSTIPPFSSAEATDGNLYVIFNFVTDDGLIWTYRTNGGFGYQNINPLECKGWKVVNNSNYLFQFDINSLGGGTISGYQYSNGDVQLSFVSSIWKDISENNGQFIQAMLDNHD